MNDYFYLSKAVDGLKANVFGGCSLTVRQTNISDLQLFIVTLDDVSRLKNEGTSLEFAYAITTSGTTGIPKIVKVPHRCIVPNILHIRLVAIDQRSTTVLGQGLQFIVLSTLEGRRQGFSASPSLTVACSASAW